MVSKVFLGLAALAAMIGTAKADFSFPGGPRYDGTIKIVALDGPTCPPGQVGQVFPTAYRAKVTPSQIEEAISVEIPPLRGAVFVVAVGGGGTLAGNHQQVNGTFILDAYRAALPDGEFNLRFRPATITADTTDFTFKGTYQNFLVSGCLATIRGVFTKR